MIEFLFKILKKVIPDGNSSKWDSEFCGFRNFIIKLLKIFWVSMADFLKISENFKGAVLFLI